MLKTPKFSGHVGEILENYARKIFNSGADVIFLVSPDKNETLPLCMGLIQKLYRKSFPLRDEDDIGNKEEEREDGYIIPFPCPVGYYVNGKKQKSLRWTCFHKYGQARKLNEILEKRLQRLENCELEPECLFFKDRNPHRAEEAFLHPMFNTDKDFNLTVNKYEDLLDSYAKFVDRVISTASDIGSKKHRRSQSEEPECAILQKKLPSRLEKMLRNGLDFMCSIYEIPAPEMFRLTNATKSFSECQKNVTVIDRDEQMWPVSFELKLGKGRLIVFPDWTADACYESIRCSSISNSGNFNDDSKASTSEGQPTTESFNISDLQSTKTDFKLLIEENLNRQLMTTLEKYGIPFLLPRTKSSKHTNIRRVDNIDSLARMLVIWCHSVEGNGIMYRPVKQVENIGNKIEFPRFTALDKSNNRVQLLLNPLFAKIPQGEEPIQAIKRDISSTIFGHQQKLSPQEKIFMDTILKSMGNFEIENNDKIKYKICKIKLNICLSKNVLDNIEKHLSAQENIEKDDIKNFIGRIKKLIEIR